MAVSLHAPHCQWPQTRHWLEHVHAAACRFFSLLYQKTLAHGTELLCRDFSLVSFCALPPFENSIKLRSSARITVSALQR